MTTGKLDRDTGITRRLMQRLSVPGARLADTLCSGSLNTKTMVTWSGMPNGSYSAV